MCIVVITSPRSVSVECALLHMPMITGLRIEALVDKEIKENDKTVQKIGKENRYT